MRAIWTILSTIAVANLVALLSFLGWLKMTDRLSMERVKAVREVITPTLAQDAEKKKTDEAAAKEAAGEAKEKARHEAPPLTAEAALAIRDQAAELERQKVRRLEREVADLTAALDLAKTQFVAAKGEIERERAEAKAALEAGESSPQFKKTVGVLEAVKPAEARNILAQMLVDGVSAAGGATVGTGGTAARPTESGLKRVVGYLNAMQDRTRAKVISEFQKEDPGLAADLLERLRAFGTVVLPSGRGAATRGSATPNLGSAAAAGNSAGN
jgi:membrane protein involved in colicin uptake